MDPCIVAQLCLTEDDLQARKIRNRYRNLPLLSALFAAALLFGLATPAQANPVTSYLQCFDDYQTCNRGHYAFSSGSFTWYNRTAYVSGDVNLDTSALVVNPGGSVAFIDSVEVVFEAYAPGGVKIEGQTRTVSRPDESRHFGFTIGDTNLVGGIERIKVTVCIHSPARWCGSPVNYYSL